MDTERRNRKKAVPDDVNGLLTEEQVVTLSRMEGFGWKIKFIRRPLFQEVVPVLVHVDSELIGILQIDGSWDTEPNTEFRE